MLFRARELREGATSDELRRQMNEAFRAIERDLVEALTRSKVSQLITAATYAAAFGEVARFAPPSAGTRLILPEPNLARLDARVTAVCEAATGALSVEVVNGTINGATTLTFLAGIGTVEFILTSTGWYAWSASLFTVPLTSLAAIAADSLVANPTGSSAVPVAHPFATLAGAGLSYAAGALAVVGSTSIEVASDEVRRAALTGEVTASANANATTVARATDFQASPWTGPHQFNGEIRGGTLTSSSSSGALNITLDAGSTRLLLSSSSTITLGTISGAADGRLLFLEHSGTGALVITHDPSTANAVACPGDTDLFINGRGGVTLVGRLGAAANWKVFDHQIDPGNLLPITTSRGVLWINRTTFAAGAAGTADDVTIYNASAPFAFRIVDAYVLISTAIALSTVQLRDTSGGGGAALSSALTSATAGTIRNNDTATPTVASGGSVFLRRSDRGVAGEVIVVAVRN